MADSEHLKNLNQGVGIWNEWQEEDPHINPDLMGADLSKVKLRNTNLINADLREVDLSDADLRGENLIVAKLRYANLTKKQAYRQFHKLEKSQQLFSSIQALTQGSSNKRIMRKKIWISLTPFLLEVFNFR